MRKSKIYPVTPYVTLKIPVNTKRVKVYGSLRTGVFTLTSEVICSSTLKLSKWSLFLLKYR